MVLAILASRYGILPGIFAGLCGIGACYYLGVFLWKVGRNRRLIVTRNALQVVEWRDKLVGHVPFNNIHYVKVLPRFYRSNRYASHSLHVELHLIDNEREDWMWFEDPPADSNADVDLSNAAATNQQRLLRTISKAIEKAGVKVHIVDWTPQ